MKPCIHCGADTELLCSDCAIENELEHVGLPVCSGSECRRAHDEWHEGPMAISELESALNRGAEIVILPNGRIISRPGSDGDRPLTFREDLGGEYAEAA